MGAVGKGGGMATAASQGAENKFQFVCYVQKWPIKSYGSIIFKLFILNTSFYFKVYLGIQLKQRLFSFSIHHDEAQRAQHTKRIQYLCDPL